MFALLPHTEVIVRMDYRVPASVRRAEGLSLLPTTVEPVAARGRALSLSIRLPRSHQCCLIQRRRKGTKARVLREPSASRCWRKIPTDGKAGLCISYNGPQTQTVLSSLYGKRPDWQALATGDEQPRDCGSIGVMGHRAERIWHPVPPTVDTLFCNLHLTSHGG